MNYAEMSDAHIAAEVLKIKHGEVGFIALYGANAKLIRDDDTFSFDLNDPRDVWPIIVENKISIFPFNEFMWQAWFTDSGIEGIKHRVFDKNPLRAAMIVFLMMNEE